jgi:hypothetical protein
VISFAVSAPGRYAFGRVKITYSIDGVEDWQYQSLSEIISYSKGRAGSQVSAGEQSGNGCTAAEG